MNMFKTALNCAFKRSRCLWNQVAAYCECYEVPDVCYTSLCNGVRVATEENDSPFACVSLFIEAGPRFETSCNNGISHFIEHMAYKGFLSLNKLQLETLVAQTGSRMTAETRREMQIFSVQCPNDCVGNFIEILSMIITELEFNSCEIEQEHRTITQELIDSDNDPQAVLFDYLHATAFQGTPLGQRVIGPSRNICRFDKLAATTFLCDHYQPYKFVLATSGQVMHEQMVCFAESRFGCLPCDPSSASEDGPCRFTGSEVVYRDDSMPLAHVAIAFEVPGYADEAYSTLLVMKHVLGSWHRSQGGGMLNANPLARAASVASLCQSFEAFYIAYRDVGLWGIYFIGEKLLLDVMIANIQDQWMKFYIMAHDGDVLRGMNLAQLEVAKRYTGVVNSSYEIGTQTMYIGKRQPLSHLRERLCAVKVHSIKEAAEKYLYDRCPAVAAVGPTEAIPEYNRIRSGMYWLRL